MSRTPLDLYTRIPEGYVCPDHPDGVDPNGDCVVCCRCASANHGDQFCPTVSCEFCAEARDIINEALAVADVDPFGGETGPIDQTDGDDMENRDDHNPTPAAADTPAAGQPGPNAPADADAGVTPPQSGDLTPIGIGDRPRTALRRIQVPPVGKAVRIVITHTGWAQAWVHFSPVPHLCIGDGCLLCDYADEHPSVIGARTCVRRLWAAEWVKPASGGKEFLSPGDFRVSAGCAVDIWDIVEELGGQDALVGRTLQIARQPASEADGDEQADRRWERVTAVLLDTKEVPPEETARLRKRGPTPAEMVSGLSRPYPDDPEKVLEDALVRAAAQEEEAADAY